MAAGGSAGGDEEKGGAGVSAQSSIQTGRCGFFTLFLLPSVAGVLLLLFGALATEAGVVALAAIFCAPTLDAAPALTGVTILAGAAASFLAGVPALPAAAAAAG